MLKQSAVLADVKNLSLGSHGIILYDEYVGFNPTFGDSPFGNKIKTVLRTEVVGIGITCPSHETAAVSNLIAFDRGQEPTLDFVPIDESDSR
jgi:hypothetical protein